MLSRYKPSDLIPELQGRLPIRVELEALTSGDFVRILTEQGVVDDTYHALLNTEGKATTEDGFSALLKWLSTSMKPLKHWRVATHAGALNGRNFIQRD